jgi:2-isopropylmalate synthase
MQSATQQTGRPQPWTKYRPYPPVDLPDRQWPARVIERAPAWCSVDLRDGNQALVRPMGLAEKLELFALLVGVGFREIEVGFPSAALVEHDFTRRLIGEGLVPEGVTIQVLTQAREHLIRSTFEALRGARRAIVHLYNSTSTLQRRVVFGLPRAEILALAVRGAAQLRAEAAGLAGTDVRFEYSPESFTGTELPFALEICEAVLETLGASAERPVIINLPATVEMATPNVYADQIEWFRRRLARPERAILSVHAHNDRGTAVAATELALLAGAARVEGTLFGNGERTGNVDLVTLALNLCSQGIDPGLDFGAIDRVVEVHERCTGLPVHPRHPYAGALVFTAFSGSHQDAIRKGMKARAGAGAQAWEVPYLPLDPADVGRTYEAVIRINSQSGKGGVAWVLEQEYGYALPKALHPEVGRLVQRISDSTGAEVTPPMIRAAFEAEYFGAGGPLALVRCRLAEDPDAAPLERSSVRATIAVRGVEREVAGLGNGPIDAFCAALRGGGVAELSLLSYHEHALGRGSGSQAVSYIEIEVPSLGSFTGVGVDPDIAVASFRAILAALNRAEAARGR